MIRFNLTIESADDAITNDPKGEVMRALTKVCVQVSRGKTEGVVQDANGNTIGKWSFDAQVEE